MPPVKNNKREYLKRSDKAGSEIAMKHSRSNSSEHSGSDFKIHKNWQITWNRKKTS